MLYCVADIFFFSIFIILSWYYSSKAVNEHDYHRWMTALYKASSGADYVGGPGTPIMLSPPDSPPSRRFQYNDSISAGRVSNSSRFSNEISTSSESTRSIQSVQDATELQRVLEISMHEI